MPAISPVLALLLAGCNSDDGLTVYNTPPEATIVEPGDGSTLADGITVALVGVAVDADDDRIEVSWRLDGVEACGPKPPDDQGQSRCEITPTVGTHEVFMLVTDDNFASGDDSIQFTIVETEAPHAEITAPAQGDTFNVSQLVTLEGTVSDLEDGASDLTVWWESNRQDLSDLSVTVDSDGSVKATTYLDAGTHALSLKVADTDGKTASDQVTITMEEGNTAPTCAITAPTEGDIVDVEDGVDLVATVLDAEQAEDTLTVTLSSDLDGSLGTATPDSAGLVQRNLALSQGDHTLTLTVTDAEGDTCTDNVGVTVEAAPSVEIVSPTSGTTFDEGERVTVVAVATDAADPETSLVAAWSSDLDGALGSGSPDSDGDLSFNLDGLSVGDHRITLQVTDTVGLSSTENLDLTINGLPTAPVVQITPTEPTTGEALTATITTASTDPEGGTVTYVYEWAVDEVVTPYSSSSVPASGTSKDQTWTVTVTPRDSSGSLGPSATDEVTVVDSPPALRSVTLSPSAPTVEDTITASASATDADGDSISYAYAWTVDGVASSTTASSLSTGFAKGQVVAVTVTPTADGVDGSSASAEVTIVNSPPTAPVLSISPDEPYAGEDTLTCSIDSFSTDADGDEITYDVSWTVDGVDAGITDYSVDFDETAPGDFWVCTVAPYDDEDEGDNATASVTVLGDPVDYAHVQYPCTLALAPGEEGDVYGWVYKTGVTDSAGAGTGIDGQVGYGPTDADPSDDDSDWTWFDASYNDDKDGLSPGDLANDEYLGLLTAPDTVGSYMVVFRFTTDGGASWSYADLGDECGGSGTTDGFDLADGLPLTVSE